MILVTGANGLLGQQLLPLLKDAVGVDRADGDLTKEGDIVALVDKYNPDLIVHLAAYTDVAKADLDQQLCYDVNVVATRTLAKYAKRLLYICTDYIFDGERGNYKESDYPNPVNFYSLTKLLGEYEALKNPQAVSVRTCLKPRPFKHNRVPGDMYFSGDYVDIIAKELVIAVEKFDQLPQIINIGTGRKRLIDLAKQTLDNVIEINRSMIVTKLPKDTSLDTTLWEGIKNG